MPKNIYLFSPLLSKPDYTKAPPKPPKPPKALYFNTLRDFDAAQNAYQTAQNTFSAQNALCGDASTKKYPRIKLIRGGYFSDLFWRGWCHIKLGVQHNPERFGVYSVVR